MDLPNSNNQKKLLTLNQAAQELGVQIDTLIQWNDLNILKPTITPNGEAGYTQEQINKFAAIKNLSREIKGSLPVHPQINSLVINKTQNIYVGPELSSTPRTNGSKLFSFKMISSFSAVVILLMIVMTQVGKSQTLLGQNQPVSQNGTDNTKAVLASRINSTGFSQSALPPTQADKIMSDKSLGNNNIAVSEDKLDQAPLVQSKLTGSGGATGINNLDYREVGNLPKNTNAADNLFDARGNIKGETGNQDVLAMAFGVTGMTQNNNSIKPVTDSNILLTFLALGLLYVIFILRKQLIYSAKISASMVPHNFPDNIEKKILEVNQKTDGTVALYFRGREYRLCKPDLDSESDQFIERLMRLAAPGVKEIDYDALSDSEIKFNASLSKLVTRLGFVGIKRDLFFPRTSKNRVLFRRYITEQDLISLNLSTADFNQIFE
jgi:hypothetical protein